MVLGHWLERGLGQFLAPDQNYEPDPDALDTKSDFWNTFAPDPNFQGDSSTTSSTPSSARAQAHASKRDPPESAFRSPGAGAGAGAGPLIRCIHCNELTPAMAQTSTSTPARAQTTTSNAVFTPSPVSQQQPSLDDPENRELYEGVVQATTNLAHNKISAGHVREKNRNFLLLCSSNAALNKNTKARLVRLLKADLSLAACRAVGLGGTCPDGYTPLLAAANRNNLVAAEILLDKVGPVLLRDVDVTGKTALHIAAEQGHLEMVEFLKQRENDAFGTNAIPKVDLVGRTALGAGLTSPEGKARTNKGQLEKILFSPVDRSIFGSPAPVQNRVKANPSLQLVYGVSDMPGKRVIMEDAMVATSWEQASLGCTVGLFAVCDGHGDGGLVSNYVAEQIPIFLADIITTSTTTSTSKDTATAANVDWTVCCKQACLKVDAQLKTTGIPGGSTAVLALVTNDTIVVANVGDSRCILIQQTKNDGTAGGLEEAVEKLTLKESPLPKKDSTFSVTALSHDHKPDLKVEQARIEKAGLTVFAESFQENGEEVVIHKVELSSDARLATSRAFGDFEYKASEHRGDDEQAVVAVPDVVIHGRDSERDSYLVLACDGVWDVMTNEQVADFVVEHVEGLVEKEEVGILPSVGDKLLAECLKRGSGDNMSVIVVALSKAAEKVSGGKVLQGKTLDFTS
jgi:protein phosphatase 1B